MTNALIIYGALMVAGAAIVLAVGWQERRRQRLPVRSESAEKPNEAERGAKGGAED